MAHKVLVVDDEPKWLRIVDLYLRGQGYEVTTTLSGQEAIEKVRQDRPDVVVADISMPGMDGYELCRVLRSDAGTRTIPFIFLTGRDDDTDRLKARKIGSDDYLTKPCPLERLMQSVDTLMDRINQAKKIPLGQVGLSGKIEEVDLLDLIQTLELDQKTGALVLSHGERTGTLYFRDGVIVDADIRSPKREEPLFVLLGWKTGNYLFLPDALPDRMPITASLANLLLQDFRTMEAHEQKAQGVPQQESSALPHESVKGPEGHVLWCLDELARRAQGGLTPGSGPHLLRILVVGVARSGKSELIQRLVSDLSGSRWTATGVEEPQARYRTDFGRVMISRDTVLHLIAVRAEKRYWPVWEQLLPGALGAIVLVNSGADASKNHVRAFLKARQTLTPNLPLQVLVSQEASPEDWPELEASDRITGSLQDHSVRLTLLDRLLQQCLVAS